ncbi:Bromodomain-containing protein [Gigaspora rosea]|uniref:Bromodomain-containing protein n=1 Tax=Gigaspora rosea TaxID=44941 RepID=A0A397U4X6_9GLOM|nr:Bromodomain-containing protein [Gigaspora rosea]CAG8459717.1 25935_t:CDS:1 [Gigaspora rosea]
MTKTHNFNNNTSYDTSLCDNNVNKSQASWFRDAMAREHQKFCSSVLKSLKNHPSAVPFLEPVDPTKYGITDYFDIIKKPMDLGTVEKKLNNYEYSTVLAFVQDVRQIFANCIMYNGTTHSFSTFARDLDNLFNQLLSKMPGVKEEPTVKVEPSVPDPKICLSGESLASKAPVESINRPKRTIRAPSKDLPEAPSVKRKKSKLNQELSFCRDVIRELRKKVHWAYAYPFYEPVDAEKLGVPDYYKIITHPMDLSTINRKLESGQYSNADEFESDIRLMFQNCYTYNGRGSEVYNMGKMLEAVFDKKWSEKPIPQYRRQIKVEDFSETNSSSDDDESDDHSDHIRALQLHLEALSSEISQITKKRKPSKLKKKHGSKKSPSAGTGKKSLKRAKTETKKSLKTPRGSIKKPLKSPRSSIKQEKGLTPVQKVELGHRIQLLSADQMAVVANLIRESGAPIQDEDGEFSFEIDSLDIKTAREMYDYVIQNTAEKAKVKKKQPPAKKPRTQSLVEEQEAQILALERTLAKFERNSATSTSEGQNETDNSNESSSDSQSSNDDSSDSQSSDSSGSDSEDSGSESP